jgi:hypothetical protein
MNKTSVAQACRSLVLLTLPLAFLGLAGNASAQPVLNPQTGHYYELVLSTDIGWFAARHGAAGRSYQGLPGHLVTIASVGENNFLYATFSTGPADALAWTGGWEPNDDGVWRWAVAPEAGAQYASGSSPDPPGSYVNWVGAEPNDFAADEDFMSYLIGGFSGFEGGWADSPEVSTGSDPIVGYLVEYESASSSGVILDPGTGNHYELVLATGIGWFAARDQAAQRTFLGLPGPSSGRVAGSPPTMESGAGPSGPRRGSSTRVVPRRFHRSTTPAGSAQSPMIWPSTKTSCRTLSGDSADRKAIGPTVPT